VAVAGAAVAELTAAAVEQVAPVVEVKSECIHGETYENNSDRITGIDGNGSGCAEGLLY
jgi:hypothetical protein